MRFWYLTFVGTAKAFCAAVDSPTHGIARNCIQDARCRLLGVSLFQTSIYNIPVHVCNPKCMEIIVKLMNVVQKKAIASRACVHVYRACADPEGGGGRGSGPPPLKN